MTVATRDRAVDEAREEYARYFEGHGATTDQVWREVTKAWFCVLAFTTRDGRPRSCGLVYATSGRKIFIQVHPGSLKAREIQDGDEVSVTVLVRRGGLLASVMPIPPGAISFRATAAVHAPGTMDLGSLSKIFAALPEDMRRTSIVYELEPVGDFLTFGIGMSLMEMRDLNKALGRAPIA